MSPEGKELPPLRICGKVHVSDAIFSGAFFRVLHVAGELAGGRILLTNDQIAEGKINVTTVPCILLGSKTASAVDVGGKATCADCHQVVAVATS